MMGSELSSRGGIGARGSILWFPSTSPAGGCPSDLMVARGCLRSGFRARSLVFDKRQIEVSINDVPYPSAQTVQVPRRGEFNQLYKLRLHFGRRGRADHQSFCQRVFEPCWPFPKRKRMRLTLSWPVVASWWASLCL